MICAMQEPNIIIRLKTTPIRVCLRRLSWAAHKMSALRSYCSTYWPFAFSITVCLLILAAICQRPPVAKQLPLVAKQMTSKNIQITRSKLTTFLLISSTRKFVSTIKRILGVNGIDKSVS